MTYKMQKTKTKRNFFKEATGEKKKTYRETTIKITVNWRTKMVAEVDTLSLLTQAELTENQTARKSDTKEIKNKHSSRPVGGAEMGSLGREDSRSRGGTETGGVWDKRAGSLTTGGLCGPTFAHR